MVIFLFCHYFVLRSLSASSAVQDFTVFIITTLQLVNIVKKLSSWTFQMEIYPVRDRKQTNAKVKVHSFNNLQYMHKANSTIQLNAMKCLLQTYFI